MKSSSRVKVGNQKNNPGYRTAAVFRAKPRPKVVKINNFKKSK